MHHKQVTLSENKLTQAKPKSMVINASKLGLALGILLVSSGLPFQSHAQDRWFTIELSIFTNESPADRNQELWQADRTTLDYPEQLIRLRELTDILLIDSLLPSPQVETTNEPLSDPDGNNTEGDLDTEEVIPEREPSDEELLREAILEVGPMPAKSGTPFQFFDIERSEYLKLPDSVSDFSQTNRALIRSPDHRLLYHAIWRQPVVEPENATSLYIEGGNQFFNQSELQGNLTVRFNENADRVVLDADIWLSEFAIEETRSEVAETNSNAESLQESQGNSNYTEQIWQLPKQPKSISDGPLQLLRQQPELENSYFSVSQVFHMQQSRGMRSNEFHYLDHPALGIVVMVKPYELPELPETDDSSLPLSEPDLLD